MFDISKCFPTLSGDRVAMKCAFSEARTAVHFIVNVALTGHKPRAEFLPNHE